MAMSSEEMPDKDVPIDEMCNSSNPNTPMSRDYYGMSKGAVHSEAKKPEAPIEESGNP